MKQKKNHFLSNEIFFFADKNTKKKITNFNLRFFVPLDKYLIGCNIYEQTLTLISSILSRSISSSDSSRCFFVLSLSINNRFTFSSSCEKSQPIQSELKTSRVLNDKSSRKMYHNTKRAHTKRNYIKPLGTQLLSEGLEGGFERQGT